MYETHKLTANYPMSFASFKLSETSYFTPHWHENIELIHVTKGNIRAILDSKEVCGGVGNTLVVNTNAMHQFFSTDGDLEYHCLIMSVEFLKQLGLDFSELKVAPCVKDDNITLLFSHIADIVKNKLLYYKPESLAETLKIASILLRNYTSGDSADPTGRNNAKTELVKKSISYMKKNFEKQITLEDICCEIGVSKCYFCHAFKEITGMTAIKMLNFIRCQEAKRLFLNSEGNVWETAHRCGFENMSYFTKTYKSIMGELPSKLICKSQGKMSAPPSPKF